MGRSGLAYLAMLISLALCAGRTSAEPQALPELQSVVAKVGERVADYYRRAASLICLEKSRVQPISHNWSPEGMSRTVESELCVEGLGPDGLPLPEAKVVRTVRRVNGREPNQRDLKDRSGCTDPTPFSTEPLAFLLPSRREEYRFTSVKSARDGDRAAMVLDFVSTIRKSGPELIKDEWGHDDCFDWRGPIASRGRLWIDAVSHDVIRLERHVDGPLDVTVPWALQRSYGFPMRVVIDRDDVTVRFKQVSFKDPEEVLLLPESIEAMTVVRGGLQSYRRVDTYTDYHRFRTDARVK